MAPKNKVPTGEMTGPELRKLIRAHNILSKIVIPKGTDRNGLIKLIQDKKYVVDHKNKVIRPKQQRGKQITLKKAEELTKPKPVSEEVKKKRAEKKKEQEELKKKDIKIAKKEAVQEFKSKQKEAKKKIKKAGKLNEKKDLKIKSISNNKKDMGETTFIKNQKKLQLQKQKETRRALLKQKVPVDKSTRRGKPVKKKEEEKKLTLAEKKEKLKQLEKEASELEKKKSEKKEILKSEKKKPVKKKGGDPINKLTGPEAEELAEKIEKLMEESTSPNKYYIGKIFTYNLKERKDLFKILLSGKYMGPKNITKDQYNKLTDIEKKFYTQKITGLVKKPSWSYFNTDSNNYMLLPQLYMTGKLFGETIPLWDMDKIVQTIEDYLKGDIGTKKKEKKKLEVKDFNILLMGKNYNKEEFLKWVDKEGYKLSKGQLEKLNDLVVIYKLQSFRKYFNSNGVLVLVPTLKFNAYDRNEKVNVGEVFSELAGERGGSVLKLELKPKEKIELTPEKIKSYDMSRLKFIQDELPSIKKTFKENKDKLEPYEKEYNEIKKKTNRDKNEFTPYSFLSSRGILGIRDLQVAKGKDWLTKIDKKWDNENKKNIETKLYAPQELREWFNKNNLTIQKLNLISDNMDSTITSYENMEKKIKKKYDL
jgi:hypothetical protein